MTHRFDAWVGCVVVALGACGTPDNGGTEISFGPVSVSTTAPGTIGDATAGSSESGESSSTGDDPLGTTSDPLPTTDPGESSESSGASDESSSSSGGDAAVDCVGLDEATCTVTLGCGWPNAEGDGGGLGGGPCGWDPAACPGFDQQACAMSPACVFMVGEQNEQLCTGVSCELLDQLGCPTVAGCVWYADPEGGGICFGNGFG